MKLRIQITKEKAVKYISHLEYARTISRALRRAKLPVKYSEGFNPHIKMSLASALGVGIASLSEYAEIELEETLDANLAVQKLNQALPDGIKVLRADVIDKKADAKLMAMLRGASYLVIVADGDREALKKVLGSYPDFGELAYKKKTPPGKPDRVVDMKYYVSEVSFEECPQGLKIMFDCLIEAKGTIKPQEFICALDEKFSLDIDIAAIDITRTALYKDEKKNLLD